MSGRKPKYLQDVVTAISELKERSGSSVKKVMDQVQKKLIATDSKPKRNLVMNIHKAIAHGVEKGIIIQKSGRVSLGEPEKVRKVGANTKHKIVKRVRLVGRPRTQNIKRTDIKTNKRRKRKTKKAKRGRKPILKVANLNKTGIKDSQDNLEEVEENKNNNKEIDGDPNSDNEPPINQPIIPPDGCENPDCICNLKEEPVDQNNDYYT